MRSEWRRNEQFLPTFLLSLSTTAGCTSEPQNTVEHLDPGTILPDGLPFSEAIRVDDTLYLSGMID